MKMSTCRFLSYLFITLIIATTSSADDTHYINMIVGERASGMSGAYTAVSDDTAGCYYNPAGIALAPGNKFSASVNAINKSTKVYKAPLATTSGASIDWEQESFSLLPNFFGIIQKFGPGMAGFSYAVPDSVQMRQKQTFTDIQGPGVVVDRLTLNLNDIDKTYLFGPSYAYKISDALSIGTTLYYYYRDLEIITNQFIELDTGDEIINNAYSTKTEHGIKPIIGVLWEPMDKLALGLTFARLWLTSSETEVQTIQNSLSDTGDFTLTTPRSEDKEKKPLSTSLGAAWFHSPSLLFSMDVKYFEDVEDKEEVLNIALGTEYYPTDIIAVRGGLYTDFSNAKEITTATISDVDHIDIYGMTLSGTLFSGKSSITLGIDYSFGKGDSQVISESNTIYDVEFNNLSLHLSTAISY